MKKQGRWPLLEVCTGSITSVRAARDGGAERVELCAALDEGGVTPSAGLMALARSVDGIKVNVLIRPRGGDFVYNEDETQVMIEDIRTARRLGMDGVVIGALTPDGDVDIPLCRRLMEEASGMTVTFHRAFDMCRDPRKALEDIISLGCDILLTSGQRPSAFQGMKLLEELMCQAGGRICVMAGSGVNSGNAAEISRTTGCPTLHASARRRFASRMRFRNPDVTMGNPDSDEYSVMETSPEEVNKILKILTAL